MNTTHHMGKLWVLSDFDPTIFLRQQMEFHDHIYDDHVSVITMFSYCTTLLFHTTLTLLLQVTLKS